MPLRLKAWHLTKFASNSPELQRNGFAAAVCDLEEVWFEDYRCGLVPDGWFVEHGGTYGENDEFSFSMVTCIEVEDSNSLSLDKLRRYRDLWWALDEHNHELRLFVFDRYGLNQRELNIYEMFYAQHGKGVERVA